MKITCPRCNNIVGKYEVSAAEVCRIEVWTRRGTSYRFEGSLSTLPIIRLTAQCGIPTCGHEWDVFSVIVAAIHHRGSPIGTGDALINPDDKQVSDREKVNAS